MLDGWLEYHRETLAWKCEGLTPDQLRERSVAPSSMSLLGLVRHMAEVERSWWRRTVEGVEAPPFFYERETNPDGDFDDVDTADVDEAFARWREECEHGRAVAAARSLDDLSAAAPWSRHGDDRPVSLRWVLVHLVEEYARHNGHADLIRERIDGVTGD
jgi:uncharacterized damage-inducible protein DinB